MNSLDLPRLLALLRLELADVPGMSVALSGSLARGDHRTGANGRIVSDLDLIPVVPTAAHAPTARAVLQPVLSRLAQALRIEATAAITTLDAFHRAARARYRTSMWPEWLIDGLGLGPNAFNQPAPDHTAELPWAIQPITYYLAKATDRDPRTNLAKARRAANLLLAKGVGEDLLGASDDLPRSLRNLIHEHHLDPLASTAAFLDAPTRPDISRAVRDAVFRENQGLPCAESVLVVPAPTLPH
ncbi:hypothetical protein [Kitasatospora viridis]|uniref:hypothetical protein n=1 Tax=Kitasatospora viridis TaxID=281105 RepID=UPI0011A1C760|nr:hypothetical protein [Kitasatospora viridis]